MASDFILWMLQAEYILDLHKQLSLLGEGSRKDLNGAIAEESVATSITPTDKVSFYPVTDEPSLIVP